MFIPESITGAKEYITNPNGPLAPTFTRSDINLLSLISSYSIGDGFVRYDPNNILINLK